MGSDSTHWRTGTSGITWSARWAAVCDICRAPHDGHKPRSFATEGAQHVEPTVGAAQAQEAMGQDAAFEEGVEPILDELRQVGAGSVFGLGEEGHGVFLHQAVQRGLFRAVALVMDLGAIRRPLALPADGLDAWLPR